MATGVLRVVIGGNGWEGVVHDMGSSVYARSIGTGGEDVQRRRFTQERVQGLGSMGAGGAMEINPIHILISFFALLKLLAQVHSFTTDTKEQLSLHLFTSTSFSDLASHPKLCLTFHQTSTYLPDFLVIY